MMKNKFLFVLLCSAPHYAYSDCESKPYSLCNVENMPIPKIEFVKLVTTIGLNLCVDAKSEYNTTKERCESDVLVKTKSCKSEIMNELPDYIDSKDVYKKHSFKYLNCIAPYFYCKGIEVKNESEAREHCG